MDIVSQVEAEGQFPTADDAFDSAFMSLALTQMIEERGKHWVSNIARNRTINWCGAWRQAGAVADELRAEHPESFRQICVRGRNGESIEAWVFTKVVRLKKYGKKRWVIVHEQADLRDEPKLLLSDALHWEGGRIIQTWSYRWSVEVFHEFAKQITGLEASQVRKEQAVNRHLQLSCVAQSLLQRTECAGQKSERFKFAGERQTIGQRVYGLQREAGEQLIAVIAKLLAGGASPAQVLELVMPTG